MVWDVGDLSGGQAETLDIVVTVDPVTPGGTVLTNTASVSGDDFDPDPANNSDMAMTTVDPACTLEITPSYDVGTLNVDILVGTFVPATANLWGTFQSEIIPMATGQPVLVTDPPITESMSVPVPPSGVIGLLATMTTPMDGIICSDFKTVDTGAAP